MIPYFFFWNGFSAPAAPTVSADGHDLPAKLRKRLKYAQKRLDAALAERDAEKAADLLELRRSILSAAGRLPAPIDEPTRAEPEAKRAPARLPAELRGFAEIISPSPTPIRAIDPALLDLPFKAVEDEDDDEEAILLLMA